MSLSFEDVLNEDQGSGVTPILVATPKQKRPCRAVAHKRQYGPVNLDDIPEDLAATLLPEQKSWLDAMLLNKAKMTKQVDELRRSNKTKNDMVYRLKRQVAKQPKTSMKRSFGTPPVIQAAMRQLPVFANIVRSRQIQPNFPGSSSGLKKKTNGTGSGRSSRSNSPTPTPQDEHVPAE